MNKMDKTEYKSRKLKRRKRRFILISFILLYLLFRSIPSLYASSLKTTLAERGYIEEKINTKGIIVKDEKVFKSEGQGKLNVYKKEGERVGVGFKIAQVSLTDDNSGLKEELNEINDEIQVLEKVNKETQILKKDLNKNNVDTDSIIKQIQKSVNQQNYNEVPILKNELYTCLEKSKELSREKTLVGTSLDNLKKKKQKLTQEISTNTLNYYSNEAGIISYNIDGFEDIYSIEKLYDYKLEDLNIKKNNKDVTKIDNGNIIKVDEPVYKIMNNYHWYLLVKIDNIQDIKPLKEGRNVFVRIDDNEKIKGKIIKINQSGRQALMTIKFNDFFYKYYNKRHVNIEIIKNKCEGLKIPIKAVHEKEGIKGVYIKDISRIIKFRPINILTKNKEYVIVDEGKNNTIKIKENEEPIKTVKVFDEVLLNTRGIKEGQIIN